MQRLLIITLVVFGIAAKAANASPSLIEFLEKVEEAGQVNNYTSSFIYFHDNQIDAIKFTHANVDGLRRFRLSYLNGPSREIFHDGHTAIGVHQDGKPILLSESDIDTPINRGLVSAVGQLANQFEFQQMDSERVAGRLAKVIMVTSKDGFRYGYRFWVDAQSLVLLRSDVIDETNKIIEQFMTVEFTLHNDTPEQLLTMPVFSIPKEKNIQVAKLEKVYIPWDVRWVPEGFAIKTQEKTSWQDNISHIVFYDGLTAVSVYVKPNSAGKPQSPITLMRNGGTTMYDEIFDKFHVTVVGDIPQRTAVRIARSVIANQ